MNPQFWQKADYGLTFQNMQDIPLSELSQMMTQFPLENLPPHLHPHHNLSQWQQQTFGTLPKQLRTSPVHLVHDQRSQKVYSIPESYLQSMVPNPNQWSQNAYQRLQNELELKHQVNNFLLANQWAGDMNRGPQNGPLYGVNHYNNDNENCTSSSGDSSDQWYPRDRAGAQAYNTLDKQKHSNGGAWVTFNQL